MGEAKKKKLKKIWWGVFGAGILAVMITGKMAPGAFNLSIKLFVMVMIILTAALGALKKMYFAEALKQLAPMIEKQDDLEGYVAACQALSETTKDVQSKNIVQINISAAYRYKKMYQKAKESLLMIDPKTLNEQMKKVYFENLAYDCFGLKEYDEAVKILDTHRKLMAPCINGEYQVEPATMIILVLDNILKGDVKTAREMLDGLTASYLKDELSDDIACLNQMLERK